MGNRPMQDALEKVDDGDVAVDAPEWSNQNGWVLGALVLLAALLLGLVATVLWNFDDKLPTETQNIAVVTAFGQRVEQASAAAAGALERRRSAGDNLRTSRAALAAAKADANTSNEDLQAARQQVATATISLAKARRTYERRLAARSAALQDFLTATPTTDVDLVRAVGIGAITLFARIRAGALLAPRRSQMLSVKRIYPPPPPPTALPQGTGTSAQTTTPTGATSTPAATAPAIQSNAGPTQSEPALTQGILAAAALTAGLFGIQNTEGVPEALINVALPLIPLLGALFTRARVAPRPHLTPEEQTRLFNR